MLGRRHGTQQTVKVVPILVGNLSVAREAFYGQLLAPYLLDDHTLVVVSSDFCHWGGRFSYREVRPGYPTIAAGIEALDREAMQVRQETAPRDRGRGRAETRKTSTCLTVPQKRVTCCCCSPGRLPGS